MIVELLRVMDHGEQQARHRKGDVHGSGEFWFGALLHSGEQVDLAAIHNEKRSKDYHGVLSRPCAKFATRARGRG